MTMTFVPETLLHSFEIVPENTRVALLLRHAHRPPIEPGSYGDDVELSRSGIESSEELGQILSQRRVGRLVASPVSRCVTTDRECLRYP